MESRTPLHLSDPDCIFRHNVRRTPAGETATCRLLQQITGLRGELCDVDRSACETCASAALSPAARLNPVMPSLLFHACHVGLAESAADMPELQRSRLSQLQQWATQNIERPKVERPVTPGCDVVMCCDESNDLVHRAVDSVLQQREVAPVLHLIVSGEAGLKTAAKYAAHPQVVVYAELPRCDLFTAVHAIVTRLKTQYLALQFPTHPSRPERLASSIAMLEDWRGEVCGAAVQCGSEIVRPDPANAAFGCSLLAETLVIRVASFVDMGGFSERPNGVAEDLVYRAQQESRGVVACPLPLVDCPDPDHFLSASSRSPGPVPTPAAAPLSTPAATLAAKSAASTPAPISPAPISDAARRRVWYGRGFAMQRVACDVVLPFFDHPEYVHPAVESILQQEQADVVLHLIDDAGACGDEIFRRWRSHRSVQCYRNAKNIGPFASLNNILDRAETGLIAVQDGDDLSLPWRLHTSGNLMRLCDADILGGRTETFGIDAVAYPDNRVSVEPQTMPRSPFRWTRYPRPGVQYFLENPTALLRVAACRHLGGFANYGERHRNRTGVDTEFFARAYYAGLRIAVTRDVLVKYRCHPDSATQNKQSGYGSQARAEAYAETQRRIAIFQQRPGFDARMFGALNDFSGVTQPV